MNENKLDTIHTLSELYVSLKNNNSHVGDDKLIKLVHKKLNAFVSSLKVPTEEASK